MNIIIFIIIIILQFVFINAATSFYFKKQNKVSKIVGWSARLSEYALFCTFVLIFIPLGFFLPSWANEKLKILAHTPRNIILLLGIGGSILIVSVFSAVRGGKNKYNE